MAPKTTRHHVTNHTILGSLKEENARMDLVVCIHPIELVREDKMWLQFSNECGQWKNLKISVQDFSWIRELCSGLEK